MNKAIKENRWLILVAAILLAVAMYITFVPEIQAQGGGRCTATYVKYYSYSCRCYITQKVWRCTGYHQPRTTRSSGYNYYRNRRYY